MKKWMAMILVLALTGPVFSKSVHVKVNGLVCDFCARAVEKVFKKKKEVSKVKVDLTNKLITISFKKGESLKDPVIKKLITDSGYDVKKIEWKK